jgi:uncharacterized cupredoxin-like copper-binding protein
MMVMKRITFLAVFVICFALLLFSCSSQGYSTNLNISMADFSYTPKDLTIPAGKEITLSAKNDGKVKHEFVIMKKGTKVTAPFDDDDEPNVYWEVEVEPGESKTVTFTAPPDDGEYVVVCGTPGHFEAGMEAKLVVVKTSG